MPRNTNEQAMILTAAAIERIRAKGVPKRLVEVAFDVSRQTVSAWGWELNISTDAFSRQPLSKIEKSKTTPSMRDFAHLMALAYADAGELFMIFLLMVNHLGDDESPLALMEKAGWVTVWPRPSFRKIYDEQLNNELEQMESVTIKKRIQGDPYYYRPPVVFTQLGRVIKLAVTSFFFGRTPGKGCELIEDAIVYLHRSGLELEKAILNEALTEKLQLVFSVAAGSVDDPAIRRNHFGRHLNLFLGFDRIFNDLSEVKNGGADFAIWEEETIKLLEKFQVRGVWGPFRDYSGDNFVEHARFFDLPCFGMTWEKLLRELETRWGEKKPNRLG